MRARELLDAAPADMARQVNCESPASAPDRMAFFEAEGFRRARSFVTMRRSLAGPTPSAPLPQPLTMTEWRADLEEPTRLAHNDAFRDHWGSDPLSRERWRHFVSGVPGFRPDCSTLALDGDTVAGYALASFTPDPGGAVGWLGTIGVRRAWRHRGVASALIARSLLGFQAAGAVRAGLDVDAENPTGAVRLYESLGFLPSEESIIYAKSVEL